MWIFTVLPAENLINSYTIIAAMDSYIIVVSPMTRADTNKNLIGESVVFDA
jgi:hypothetical protein